MNPQIIAELRRTIEQFRTDLGDDDGDEVLRSDMLEGCTSIDEVLSRLVRARVRACADGAGANEAKKASAAHYDHRMDVAENAENAVNGMIKSILETAGLKKFKVPEGSISVTPGRLSLALDGDFVPPQGYEKVTVAPDKAAIKAALEAGETMPGAELVRGADVLRIV